MKGSMMCRFAAIAAVFALSAPATAWCQTQDAPLNYPTRPVRVIVPFAPGGPVDVMARLLAPKLSERFGQQFYIENQGGGGGNIGMGAAARSAPDGHTLLFVSSSFVVNPSLYEKIPFDPMKDFAPVTLVATTPNILVVNPAMTVSTAPELRDYIKANPGKLSFASAGTGTTPHLAGELFKIAGGLDLVHVPFGGSAPAIQSALAGHTPIAFTVMTPAVPHVKADKLRALAVTTAQRSPALPDVPTLIEQGFAGQVSDTMVGLLAPAGTRLAIIDMLRSEIIRVVAMPDITERFATLGFQAVANRPDEFAAQIKDNIVKWAKVIRAGNIKPE